MNVLESKNDDDVVIAIEFENLEEFENAITDTYCKFVRRNSDFSLIIILNSDFNNRMILE